MNFASLGKHGAVCAMACLVPLSGRATEYTFSPDKMDGTKAGTIVSCSTPVGWQGWKDDPHYWDGVRGLNRQLLEGANAVSASFVQPSCKGRPECPKLELETIGVNSSGQITVSAGLRKFVRQLRQHQGPRDPDPRVTRFGSFDAAAAGVLTIWQIRCSSYDDYFVVIIVHRHALVTIYLHASDVKQIVDKLDSLKELARSVRFEKG